MYHANWFEKRTVRSSLGCGDRPLIRADQHKHDRRANRTAQCIAECVKFNENHRRLILEENLCVTVDSEVLDGVFVASTNRRRGEGAARYVRDAKAFSV